MTMSLPVPKTITFPFGPIIGNRTLCAFPTNALLQLLPNTVVQEAFLSLVQKCYSIVKEHAVPLEWL